MSAVCSPPPSAAPSVHRPRRRFAIRGAVVRAPHPSVVAPTRPATIAVESARPALSPAPLDIRGRLVSDHLELLRGLMAVAVLAYHLRETLFPPLSQITDAGWFTRLLYGLSGFGHEAVVVFFVLSGYFIAGSVLRDGAKGSWSWSKYLTSRATRLYVVLIPGLLLTMVWDSIGFAAAGHHAVYTGIAADGAQVGHNVAATSSWSTLFGNLAFLQSIYVNDLGTNRPLWSLAYEFWFYILFPCVWFGLMGSGSTLGRCLHLLGAAVLMLWLPRGMVAYFGVWLLGAGLAMAPQIEALRGRRLFAAIVAGCGAIVGAYLAGQSTLVQSTRFSILLADVLLGIAVAATLYLLLHVRRSSSRGTYHRAATKLAGFSYTLYIVHMPPLALAAALLCRDGRLPTTAGALLLTGALAIVLLAYAWGLSRLTEARTESIRCWLVDWARRAPKYSPDAMPATSRVAA